MTVEAGTTASLVAQLPGRPSGPASGWISVTTPKSVQLFEDGRLLGSSDTERLMVSAGTHQLDIVNDAIGYRNTRTVQVTAGKVSTINVEFPKGTIALNAIPWADVWIDGEKVGETPIGNLPGGDRSARNHLSASGLRRTAPRDNGHARGAGSPER